MSMPSLISGGGESRAWVPSSSMFSCFSLGCFQSELWLGVGAMVGPSGKVGSLQMGRANSPYSLSSHLIDFQYIQYNPKHGLIHY